MLVAQGFAYDSRPSETFAIPERVAVTPGPHTLAGGRLWELPIASWQGWQPDGNATLAARALTLFDLWSDPDVVGSKQMGPLPALALSR